TVTGLAPGKKRRLIFIHEGKKLAGTVVVSGDDRNQPAVKLAPWGEATGRLVTADGLARPEMPRMPLGSAANDDLTRGDVPSWPQPSTDKAGKFRIVGLVPGLKYSVGVIQGNRLLGHVFKDLVVKEGEVKDLGDVQAGK